MTHRSRFVAVALAVLAPALGGCLFPSEGDDTDARYSLVVAQHYLASEAGAQILRQGGNAIDAAAAVQWALTVVEPQFSGIGGGTFLVYYDAQTGRITTLDGRETAPAAATADMHQDPLGRENYDPTLMGTAVGVPGTVALFAEALQRWGTMDLATTMAPAIDFAENGFEVTEKFASDIETYRYRIESSPAAAALYLPGSSCVPTMRGYAITTTTVARCIGGAAPVAGSTLTNPDLANTLGLIASGGPSAFYSGPIAEAIVATQAERDGRLTTQDLAGYTVQERAPISTQWKGYDVYTMDMPGSGITYLQMLKLLEQDDLATMGQNTGETLHFMVEAMHLAYADRGVYMGDPDFESIPRQGLLDPLYVAQRRALITGTAATDVRPGDPWPYETEATTQGQSRANAANAEASAARNPLDRHTSHFTIVGADGDVVSVTTTIEHLFGSGMLVPGYGFFLNNELTDFDWTPGGANEVEPFKRPRSSMSPTIVLKGGEPILALGAPGGPTIITSVYQVFLNVLEHGMSLDDAVAAPRVFSAQYPNVLVETGLSQEARADLEARGHTIVPLTRGYGSVQAALRMPDGNWHGVADARRDGMAIPVPANP